MHPLTTSLRHLLSGKLYTTINIIGLTAGMTCMLLAVLYWNAERDFDTFHAKASQIYRITTTLKERADGPTLMQGGTGQVQGPAFKAAVPELLDYVRILGGDVYADVRHEQTAFKLQMLFADSNFFKVFSFPLIAGDPATALKDINSVVISEETAMKFFPQDAAHNITSVIGKYLNLDADPSADKLGHKPMIVTGVVKHVAANSSIQFDILLPFRFLQLSFEDKNWLNAYLGTYVILPHQVDLETIAQKFKRVFQLDLNAQDQIKKAGYDPGISYGLQPLQDVHLNAMLDGRTSNEGGKVNGSKAVYSNTFLGIAFFILLLASINFINISIAGSLDRAKEVCVRKISGSSRLAIMLQFLIESAILCFAAFMLSLLIARLILPFFNLITGVMMNPGDLISGIHIIGYFSVLGLNILLSGLYPAYLLSAFKPVEVLYNRNKQIGLMRLSKIMVVGQFVLAFFLTMSMMVYYLQMNFIQKKHLGYEPGYVIRSQISGDRKYEPIQRVLKNEVAKDPSFEGISFGGEFGSGNTVEIKVADQKILAAIQSIDEQYLPVMGIGLQSGDNLAAERSHEVLVNEAFVKACNLQHPIGANLWIHPDYTDDSLPQTIVGVVSDFHFRSLHYAITPLVMCSIPRNSGGIWLKVNRNHTREALKAFERIYQSAIPGAVYQYDFLNDLTTREYSREQRWQKIITTAATLALLISFMGLFGLAHLNTRQRVKEISIRKVLGASVHNILSLLAKDYIRLVLIGLMIAASIGIYILNAWLKNFAYRIDLHWWLFVTVGMVVILLSLATVSIQGFKVAISNPVDALRGE
jgi:putative ABC transport system permease protein